MPDIGSIVDITEKYSIDLTTKWLSDV